MSQANSGNEPTPACEDACCGVLKLHLDARKRSRKLPFVVLYGSETGNSKSIAEKVHELALGRSLSAKLGPLDEYEAMGLLGEDPVFCAIIVSTTGNGDAPKGAEKMFRFVKKRTLSNTTMKAVSYSVLALGDTNYDKFCFVGKTIDARMNAVGGKQLAPVVCADDVAGLDMVVEPWIAKLWDLYASLTASFTSPSSGKPTSVPSSISSAMAGLSLEEHSNSPNDKNNGESKVAEVAQVSSTSANDSKRGWKMPATFKTFEMLATASSSLEQVVERTKRLGRARDPFPTSRYAPTKTTFREAKIVHAEYLTKDFQGEDRVVIKATLELPVDVKWDIGDALAIDCPNPDGLVMAVAQRLKLDVTQVISSNTEGTWTVKDVLTRGVNLATPPDRGFLRSLASSCTGELDRARMELIASSGGKEEYEKLVEEQKLNVFEVLQLFPTCQPTLDTFLGALGLESPPPRYYSIANSPLTCRNDNLAEICFSVVQTQLENGRVVKGICTNELERLCFLPPTSQEKTVRVYVKPNPAFKLPVDESRPIIMIGPGTGVAPFVGFIQHRPAVIKEKLEQLKASAPVCGAWRGGLDFEDELEAAEDALVSSPLYCRTPEIPIGRSVLYFGCRRPNQDYLFERELQEFVDKHYLSQLRVAFSRTEPKRYVQDLLVEDGAELVDEILHQNASVYVCGDGTKMARDVQEAMVQILAEHSQDFLNDVDQAKAYIVEMQKRGRYVQDIW